jgi:hypothetical protein
MSNGFIYVVDAHFIDKIEKKKKSWTQVPVEQTIVRMTLRYDPVIVIKKIDIYFSVHSAFLE